MGQGINYKFVLEFVDKQGRGLSDPCGNRVGDIDFD